MTNQDLHKALVMIAAGSTSTTTLQTTSRTGEIVTESMTPLQVLAQALLLNTPRS